MRLEVRHLELLLAIESSGSISGAARELGADQPHVSRQLQRIEQRLDSEVFLRTAMGVVPTATGLHILGVARKALGVLDELNVRGCAPAGDVDRTTLHVVYQGLPATEILDDLGMRYPALQVRFVCAPAREAYKAVRAGAADVFLGVWLPHVEWPPPGPLRTREIVVDPTYVHLSARHPLAAQMELSLTALAGENWIAGTDQDSSRRLAAECRLVGGFDPVLGHRVSEETALSTLLARGDGVQLGSSVASRRPGVVARPYRGSSSSRWMQVFAPDRVEPHRVAAIATLLRGRYAERRAARRAAVEAIGA